MKIGKIEHHKQFSSSFSTSKCFLGTSELVWGQGVLYVLGTAGVSVVFLYAFVSTWFHQDRTPRIPGPTSSRRRSYFCGFFPGVGFLEMRWKPHLAGNLCASCSFFFFFFFFRGSATLALGPNGFWLCDSSPGTAAPWWRVLFFDYFLHFKRVTSSILVNLGTSYKLNRFISASWTARQSLTQLSAKVKGVPVTKLIHEDDQSNSRKCHLKRGRAENDSKPNRDDGHKIRKKSLENTVNLAAVHLAALSTSRCLLTNAHVVADASYVEAATLGTKPTTKSG